MHDPALLPARALGADALIFAHAAHDFSLAGGDKPARPAVLTLFFHNKIELVRELLRSKVISCVSRSPRPLLGFENVAEAFSCRSASTWDDFCVGFSSEVNNLCVDTAGDAEADIASLLLALGYAPNLKHIYIVGAQLDRLYETCPALLPSDIALFVEVGPKIILCVPLVLLRIVGILRALTGTCCTQGQCERDRGRARPLVDERLAGHDLPPLLRLQPRLATSFPFPRQFALGFVEQVVAGRLRRGRQGAGPEADGLAAAQRRQSAQVRAADERAAGRCARGGRHGGVLHRPHDADVEAPLQPDRAPARPECVPPPLARVALLADASPSRSQTLRCTSYSVTSRSIRSTSSCLRRAAPQLLLVLLLGRRLHHAGLPQEPCVCVLFLTLSTHSSASLTSTPCSRADDLTSRGRRVLKKEIATINCKVRAPLAVRPCASH